MYIYNYIYSYIYIYMYIYYVNEWPMISLRSNFTGSRRPGQGTHYSFCPAVACWEVVGFGRPLATSCAYPSTQVPKERTNPSSCTIGTLDVEHVEHVEHVMWSIGTLFYLLHSSSIFYWMWRDVINLVHIESLQEIQQGQGQDTNI